MENMKWGKPSIEELPEHSSRARPLTESELSFRKQGGAGNKEPIEGGLEKTPAQRIARHHAEKIKDERRIKDRRNQIQEIALPVTKEDLELEKKFVAAELENFYANFDNDKDPEKVLRKDRLTNRLDQIENRLSAIPDGNNIKEGGIPVADKKDDGGANNVQENINKPNDVAQGASGDKITPAEAPPPFEEKRKRREKIEEQELNDARKSFAVADPAHGGYGAYERKKHEYEIRIDAYKDFIIEHRKLTLETKGLFEKKEDKGKGEYRKLNSEEVQYELEKYIKENVVPHFAVVEAAKIQEARIEPSFIERMKDSKWGSFAGKMIDGYRKMPWQKKLLVSAGLLGVGVTAGAVGGTFGLAVAGIVTGGKGIQRLLSGAGTAVGLDAWMQRSQQEWMKRKGWGKDRHEYISKQIALMSGKTKRGEVVDKEIEERLKERERIEKDNEMRRTGIAAIAGALVGSGAAFRVADEYLGISDKVREASNYWGDKWGHLFGGGGEAIAPHHRIIEGTAPAPETSPKIPSPVTTPAPETSPKITPPITTPAPETLAPITIKPIELSIGTRGPEGALIDEFRKDPELAKKFGWQGGSKEELSKWAGSKARVLWEHSAKQALLDPSIKQELGKLGYPETAEGYEKAMTRIGKGTVSLDIEKGSITLNAEYLKNIISPSVPSSVSIPYEELTQPSGVTVNYMVGGVPQTPIHETLLSQHTPTPSSPVPPIDFAEIQKQMDLPEGKLRGILTTSGVRSPAIEDLLKREGGVEKLLKMQVRELHGIEQGYPRDARLDRLYEGLQRITGDARLESNDTLEDVLKSIDSKKIFHGTAEEILKDEIPAPLETGASSHSEGIGTATNPEEIPAPSDQGETANETQIDERAEEAPRPSSVASTDIPREELAKSTEVKTSDMAKEIGQVSSYEVVTKTGIKGIFNYDANGKITDMKIGGSESLLRGRSLLYDNYEEIMRKKGAKLMDVRLVDLSAQKLFYQEQLLKTLEDSGQKNSDKAEFLRKAIKDATNQLESKFGNIFKK